MKIMNCRHSIAILVILLSSFIFVSCEKFLESKPISQVGVDNFFQTEADFKQAVTGAYGGLGQLYQGNGYYSLLVDLRSDNTTELTAGASGNEAKMNIDEFKETPDNEHLTAFWQDSYMLIARANSVLAKIDGASFA